MLRALIGSMACVLALIDCTSGEAAFDGSDDVERDEPSGAAHGGGVAMPGANAGSSSAGVTTTEGGGASSGNAPSGGMPGNGIAGGTAGVGSNAAGTAGAAGATDAGAAGAADAPSETCLDLAHPLELDYFLHVPIDKHLARSERSLAAEWYQELGNLQTFTLAKGELNQVDGKATGRVEAFSEPWRSQGEWHEFAASYRLIQAGGAAIFQLKAPSPIDWEVQITHGLDGSINYHPRRNPSIVLGRDMVGKDFHLRVRSNGRQFEVYYDCKLVERRDHPMDPSGASSYGFRWGLYPGMIASHDMALEVRGASWR